MGYLHIENLYRPEAQDILMFKEVYVMEKVHGTSAHVNFKSARLASVGGGLGGRITFFPGGEKYEKFVALFDHDQLLQKFIELGHDDVTIYGEAYGGKQQGMSHTYGPEPRFIVFDVKINENWLAVPQMDELAMKLGLEVVPWKKVSTDLAALDAERDAPSEVAKRRGIQEDKPREGIIIRPLIELKRNNGSRMIAKHKGASFQERQNQPKVVDPSKLEVLKEAQAIADEWVTPMRLEHVLQKLPEATGMEHTSKVIKAMVEDVLREAAGEIVESPDATKAIAKKAAELYKKRVTNIQHP